MVAWTHNTLDQRGTERNRNMMDHTPAKDLGAVFDAHVKAEFVDMDVAATMATMTPKC